MQLRRTLERVGFGLYVLLAVFLVGRQMVDKVAGAASAPTGSAQTSAIALPSPSASPAASVVFSPAAAPSASPSARASAQATADPLVVTLYQNGGRRYGALSVAPGYTLTSPIAGTVGVVVYQFLGGEVRVGSNIPTEPFYPYVTITGTDRRVILRPGALTQDVQLLVKSGDVVAAGSPLFRIVGGGASSWRAFYDRGVTAQVIASVTALPTGAELDPVAFFRRD